MRSIVAEPALVACCGLYCGACPSYLNGKCEGCRKSRKNGWCAVKKCVEASGIRTCAECARYPDPAQCKKFNNFISKVMGFVLNSNRAACVAEIKRVGPKVFAEEMAERRRRTMPRS
ncbi:MAG TPA: DUF3795 domain-containing protein [bacterium]|nr:DUF3795 domain-containing protein [bacterium]